MFKTKKSLKVAFLISLLIGTFFVQLGSNLSGYEGAMYFFTGLTYFFGFSSVLFGMGKD